MQKMNYLEENRTLLLYRGLVHHLHRILNSSTPILPPSRLSQYSSRLLNVMQEMNYLEENRTLLHPFFHYLADHSILIDFSAQGQISVYCSLLTNIIINKNWISLSMTKQGDPINLKIIRLLKSSLISQ